MSTKIQEISRFNRRLIPCRRLGSLVGQLTDAIALGHRYNMDPRDEGNDERNAIFRDEGTVFSCSYANECSEVCPKNVDPAAAINQAKFNAVIDWATKLVLPRKEE